MFPGQNIGSRPAGMNECFYSHGNDPCPSGFKCMNSTNVCVKSEHCLSQWGGDHGQSSCYHNCYYDSKGCFERVKAEKKTGKDKHDFCSQQCGVSQNSQNSQKNDLSVQINAALAAIEAHK